MFFGGSGGEGHGFSGFPGGGVRFTFGWNKKIMIIKKNYFISILI